MAVSYRYISCLACRYMAYRGWNPYNAVWTTALWFPTRTCQAGLRSCHILPMRFALPKTDSEFTPENGCLEYYSSFWDDGLFSRANCVMVNSPLIWHCRGSLRFPWWKNSEILRCSRCEFQRGYLFHIHYKLTHFALVDSWLFDVGISCLTSPGTKYPRTWNMKFQVISLI